MNKSVLPLAVISLAALNSCEKAGSMFSKKEPAPQQQQMAAPVTVMIAKPVELAVKANLPGRVEPLRQAEVRARVSGILLKRTYEEGQDVKEGDLLFNIDPATYEAVRDACQAAVQRAEANLANIQDKEKRYRPLAQKGSVSERDHTDLLLQEKMALAELASTRAELKRAELELGYTKVTSPINGRARSELVTEGALVGHGSPTPLTIVEQLDPIYVKFTQPAAEVLAIKNGVRQEGWKEAEFNDIPIQVIMPDGKTYEKTGKLVFSDLAVSPDTDTIQMKAVFDNPDYELIPGSYVRVVFDKAVRQGIYMVPRVAIEQTQQGPVALVVNENNIVEPRPVTTDGIEDNCWIVTKGLKEGDKVIVEKSMMLTHPGSQVAIARVLGQEEDRIANREGK